jgi:hypothetical protein
VEYSSDIERRETQIDPVDVQRVKIRMRHSESVKFWDETCHKLRNRINQSQSLLER